MANLILKRSLYKPSAPFTENTLYLAQYGVPQQKHVAYRFRHDGSQNSNYKIDIYSDAYEHPTKTNVRNVSALSTFNAMTAGAATEALSNAWQLWHPTLPQAVLSGKIATASANSGAYSLFAEYTDDDPTGPIVVWHPLGSVNSNSPTIAEGNFSSATDYMGAYLSDTTGVKLYSSVVGARLNQLISGGSHAIIVEDIPERDALELTGEVLVYVKDTTDGSGAAEPALYLYTSANDTFNILSAANVLALTNPEW